MLFNSFEFLIFFLIFYISYLFLNHKWQNKLLLVASYIFYSAWDWRFSFLLFASTYLDFLFANKIYSIEEPIRRKKFVIFSIIVNLAILGFFKYFNFFVSSFQSLLGNLGLHISLPVLHIILPIGISFYTFQSMSYVIDVYRRELKPTNSLSDYAIFVSFFPHLVAGPIMRAPQLLTQVLNARIVTKEKFYEGCYLIFWGLFQKVFVADNLGRMVDSIFIPNGLYNGALTLLALYAFAFQIYGDFAGYSNIARGLGKCIGFEIVLNFNLPYFSTSASEFWRRWHISLSTWLRDYLYIPLGGNRCGSFQTYRNLAITMLLGGLWHGARWTFVIWGVYHGLLLILNRILQPVFVKFSLQGNLFIEKIWFMLRVVVFFHLICFGWLLFRSQSMTQVDSMLKSIFFNFQITKEVLDIFWNLFYLSIPLIVLEAIQYVKNDLFTVISWSRIAKVCLIAIIGSLWIYYMIFGKYSNLTGNPTPFIYFQF